MTNLENPGNDESDAAPDGGGGDSVAKLMRLAGPRPAVPDDVRARVYGAVSREWHQAYRQRRVRRWGFPLALAALVLLAIALSDRQPEVAIAPIATVAAVGEPASAGGQFVPGDRIYPGDVLTTGDYGIAVTLANDFSLRLAANSTVTFDSLEELTLNAGQVYADTGRSIYDDRSITIHTSLGSAEDVGTQFAVGLADGAMRVAVREGKVNVSSRQSSYTADAGQVLTFNTDGEPDVGRLSAYDSYWNWVADLAPAFDMENRTLLEFLQWVARETGKELVFENESVRMAAMGTRPHGSVADFTPIEALVSVLRTTRFEYRIEAQRILIGASTP